MYPPAKAAMSAGITSKTIQWRRLNMPSGQLELCGEAIQALSGGPSS
jgi:hypothetical protein